MAHKGARVVAHRLDGTLYRGRTVDFRPGCTTFTVDTAPQGERVGVVVADLKALFFVKKLGGDPEHVQSNEFNDGPKVGRRVWVVFGDGEQLAGRAPAVNVDLDGFFLFPTDPASNLERAWVVTANTKSVLFGEDASEASRTFRTPRKDSSATRFSPDEWDDMLRLKDIATPERWNRAIPRSHQRVRPESDIFLGEW